MQNNIQIIRQRLQQTMQTLPTKVGIKMLEFTAERFRQQNWIDAYPAPWKARKKGWGKKNDTGRGLLMKSGRLRRSVRIVSVTANSVTIGSDVPYARAQNEGLRLGIIQHVRSYQRKRTRLGVVSRREGKRTSRVKYGRVQTGTSTVKAHTRRINQNIPARPFMGNSLYLRKQINRLITAEINKTFR